MSAAIGRITDYLRYVAPIIGYSSWGAALVLLVFCLGLIVGQRRERRRILDHLPYEAAQAVMKARANVTVWKERFKNEKRRRQEVDGDKAGLQRLLRLSAKQARRAIVKVEQDVGALRALALDPDEED